MARTNKYASINFNEIYEKKKNNKPSSVSSPAITAPPTTRSHGGMLVLTRPSPKPQTQPSPPPPPPKPADPDPDQTRSEPDSISLRPLVRTGSSFSSSSSPSPTVIQDRDKESSPSLPSAKPEPFVPPHLRPGFVGREERFGQDGQRHQGFRSRELGHGQGQEGSSIPYGEDRRPKSGGYEKMRRGGVADLAEMNRPGSSGWYGS